MTEPIRENETRERPILFSGPMVRAILDGRKTQTRRVVKGVALRWLAPEMFSPTYVADPANHLSPYGYAGDRLWVRETFITGYPCVNGDLDAWDEDGNAKTEKVWYHADGDLQEWNDGSSDFGTERIPWKPSIHMPRAVSRLTLDITAIRVERLHDISVVDAIAEGIERSDDPGLRSWPFLGATHPIKGSPKVFPTAVQAYRSLWDSLNAKRGFGWDVNPWVWVIEFRRSPSPGGDE